MSNHAWVLENLASYVAGGLDAEERDQLHEHVAGCPACGRALDQARALDRQLERLFAGVRPSATLEDRSIQTLRQSGARPQGLRLTRTAKYGLAAAAVVLMAVTGAALNSFIEEGELRLPRVVAGNKLEALDVGGGSNFLYRSSIAFGGDIPREKERVFPEPRDPAAMAEALQAKTRTALEGKPEGDILGSDFGEDGSRSAPGRKPGGAPSQGISNTLISDDSHSMATRPGGGSALADQPAADTAPPASGPTPTGGFGGKGKAKEVDGREYFRPSTTWGHLPAPGRPHGQGGEKQRPEGDDNDEGPKSPRDKDKESADTYALGKALGNGTTGLVGGLVAGQKSGKPEPAPTGRKIIRSGDIDFEVDSFDAAVAIILRLVANTKGGFVATVNSEKLPNGKVRGSVVVRVPPEHLDQLVLDLRKDLGKFGELKGQKIGSTDISKEYTDLESRLRAARTMEERLLKIIREGKGAIKDLVVAEQELGKWRTRIEEYEGELRFYANLVSLSTLTIRLNEKEIRRAAVIADNERVQAGVEVDDVEKAYRAALDAITEAQGRITKSELKQHAAGQFSALLHFEVAPESAGPLRDRLRQLGNMVRLEIDRVQQAEGGTLTLKDGKVKRGPTQFMVSLYNLANVAPRETVTLRLAAADVPGAFRKLRETLAKVKGHVVNAQLNEQDRKNVTAQLDFDIRRVEEGAVQEALKQSGALLSRNVVRAPAGENVTDAKVAFKVELTSTASITPRRTVTLGLEVADVEATLALLTAQAREVQGRVVQGPAVGVTRDGRVTARVQFDVPLSAAASIVERFKSAGVVRVRQETPHPQAPEGPLALARIDVTLSNAELLVPQDQGLWSQLRHGVSVSLRGLSMSASFLVIGLLFVLPWVLVLAAVIWLFRRLFRPAPVAVAAGPAPVSTPPAGPGV